MYQNESTGVDHTNEEIGKEKEVLQMMNESAKIKETVIDEVEESRSMPRDATEKVDERVSEAMKTLEEQEKENVKGSEQLGETHEKEERKLMKDEENQRQKETVEETQTETLVNVKESEEEKSDRNQIQESKESLQQAYMGGSRHVGSKVQQTSSKQEKASDIQKGGEEEQSRSQSDTETQNEKKQTQANVDGHEAHKGPHESQFSHVACRHRLQARRQLRETSHKKQAQHKRFEQTGPLKSRRRQRQR